MPNHKKERKWKSLPLGILVLNPIIKKKSEKNHTIRKFSKKEESSNSVMRKNKKILPSRIWVLGTLLSGISVFDSTIKMFQIPSK